MAQDEAGVVLGLPPFEDRTVRAQTDGEGRSTGEEVGVRGSVALLITIGMSIGPPPR